MIDIDELKSDFLKLYEEKERFYFNTPIYRVVHDKITAFVYQNHFQTTDEWQKISANLLYKSNQYMVRSEADVIIYNLELLKRKLLIKGNEHFWQYVHPMIKKIIFLKFGNGHYADCVESAFKEINSRLKNVCKKLGYSERDGSDLMNFIFSTKKPILQFEDTSNESGKNVQLGYMQIFAGAMTGIRNPKAHENQCVSKETAIKQIIFASLLMDKVDDALKYCSIKEF